MHSAPVLYIISTHAQHSCMISAMILITYRRKTPALVLTVLAVMLCLVNQYVITYGSVDPIHRTLYYMLEYILLIAYILIHYLAFYLIGYSPDKWYDREKKREGAGNKKA